MASSCSSASLASELAALTAELNKIAEEKSLKLAEDAVDDVLTYALFPQVGLKFLENRGDPSAFEPAPTVEVATTPATPVSVPASGPSVYSVRVNGKAFTVEVAEGGELTTVQPSSTPAAPTTASASGEPVAAALAGNVFKVLVGVGDDVSEGQAIMIVEAMKMETEVSAPRAGKISAVHVAVGDAVAVGDPLVALD